MKNKKLKEYFFNPVGMGTLKDPTHQTILKSEQCSDVIKMMIEAGPNGTVRNIATEVYGCGYLIAGTSLFNHTAKKYREGAIIIEKFTSAVSEFLDEVPEHSRGCLLLPLRAFKEIYEDFRAQ